MKLWPGRKRNRFQPQSVNPRRGTVSTRNQAPPTKPKSSKIWLVSLLTIVLVSLTATGYYLHSRVLVIQAVEVEQMVIANPESIIDQSQVEDQAKQQIGSSLFLLSPSTIASEIKQSFPQIEEVYVEKQYPDVLRVSYIPRRPTVQILNQDHSFLVDQTGYFYAQASASGIPRIQVSDDSQNKMTLGSSVSARDISLAMDLITGFNTQKLAITKVILHQNHLELVLNQPPTILVGGDKQASEVLAIIDNLVEYGQESERSIQLIDLRYDRPLIR